jgi:outer membrane lipoprotein-sorting protein
MFFPRGAAFPGEIRITEETGDITVIKFHDIRTNVKLPDSLFEFTPPPGVVLRERHID